MSRREPARACQRTPRARPRRRSSWEHFMVGRYELKDFDGTLEQLDHESHRAAIMVGGSLVEHALVENDPLQTQGARKFAARGSLI